MEERNKVYTIVIVGAIVALLLSCVVGALAGAASGFMVARRQARLLVERNLEQHPGVLPRFDMPMPRREGDPQPFGRMPLTREGALVTDVVPETPADEAGLQPGDLILFIDGEPIDARQPLADVINQYEPGDRITLEFWRTGSEESVSIRLGSHPDDPARAYLGIFYQMVSAGDIGFPQD